MTIKRTLVLSVLAFSTLAACTTGAGRFATDTNVATDAATVSASPTFDTNAGSICAENGGWYDSAAGACDDMGQ